MPIDKYSMQDILASPIWNAISALAAASTFIVSAVYSYYTFRQFQTQSQPKVVVYVKHDLNDPTVIRIVVENIGRDVARNVSFRSSRPIPWRAFGLDLETSEKFPMMDEGPLIAGIPALGPGDSRIIPWGQLGGLSAALGRELIRLDYSYTHESKTLTGEAFLDFQSHWSTDGQATPSAIAAQSLIDISKTLTRVKDELSKMAKDSTMRPTAGAAEKHILPSVSPPKTGATDS